LRKPSLAGKVKLGETIANNKGLTGNPFFRSLYYKFDITGLHMEKCGMFTLYGVGLRIVLEENGLIKCGETSSRHEEIAKSYSLNSGMK
jgi:hypothetical protein